MNNSTRFNSEATITTLNVKGGKIVSRLPWLAEDTARLLFAVGLIAMAVWGAWRWVASVW